MIIQAHSVPIGENSGLSPMQEHLLRSTKPVRLVSAPTGTGKTYAFMRAVLTEGAHVLFIVPTRRLLQNLIDDACEAASVHFKQQRWEQTRIEAWTKENILEWSGNQSVPEGVTPYAYRARQLLSGYGDTHGRILFAIPEVVVRMCSGVMAKGASTITPFTYIRNFDHVVFDEFHTIDDRAFGLACLFSLLAVTEQKAKVSLLSATPVDITGVLAKMGVPHNCLDVIAEEVVTGHPPGHRLIHGDVQVSLANCPLMEAVAQHPVLVRESLQQGHTVIVIYDSLRQLQQEESGLKAKLSAMGVPSDRILLINSLDDSERRPGEGRRGKLYADPRSYDVLLCTSTVEIGVTFQSSLMFMDPGFDQSGFIQRVGRVARGDYSGQVIVSVSPQRRERDRWIRTLENLVEEHIRLDVQTFTDYLLCTTRQQLEPTRRELEVPMEPDDSPVNFYRKASWRGMFWAALFMVALMYTRMNIQQGARNRLRKILP